MRGLEDERMNGGMDMMNGCDMMKAKGPMLDGLFGSLAWSCLNYFVLSCLVLSYLSCLALLVLLSFALLCLTLLNTA